MSAGIQNSALYEIAPPGEDGDRPEIDDLRYQGKRAVLVDVDARELLTVKLRYKMPDGDTSTLIEQPVVDRGQGLDETSNDFRFAAAVAGFGMLLRDSEYKGDLTYGQVIELARPAAGPDPNEHRAEFIRLVERSRAISGE